MTGAEYYRQIVAEVRGRGNYFKATQPDGFSFMGHPRKEYVVGKTTEAQGDGNALCGAGLLHFSDVPSETLTSGKWPARLFEVRGEIVAGFNDEHPYKGGAKRLYVVRELPAWVALGPNGRIVAEFIRAIPETFEAVSPTARSRAARALVIADLITPEHLATLYAPFEPVLPLAELRKRAVAAFPMEAKK